MKTIKATHIDTGGHGYLSVSKSDFVAVCHPELISGYSGHNLTRIFLEEDEDATRFLNYAKNKGVKVDIKQSYNLAFNNTHSYKPELFHFQPKVGTQVVLHDDLTYTVTGILNSKFIVSGNGKQYGIPMASCFKYIKGLPKQEPEPSREQVLLFASQRLASLLEQSKSDNPSVASEAKAKYDRIMALSEKQFYSQALQAYKSENL